MLKTRIVSALVLAPPVLAAVAWGYPAFHVLIVLSCVILAWEWVRVCGLAGHGWVAGLALAAAIPPVAALSDGAEGLLWAAAGAGIAAGAAGLLLATGPFLERRRAGVWLAGGAIAIGLPAGALVLLRDTPVDGRWLVLWLVGVVWAVDIGAYAAGRLIGGPRLAPRVSPNKTWAGLAGGVLGAALVGGIGAGIAGQAQPLLWAAGAAALGALEQGGDLLESAMKRHFGRKDSSGLIPGHGGLMDRVDGLWPAALALWIARTVLP